MNFSLRCFVIYTIACAGAAGCYADSLSNYQSKLQRDGENEAVLNYMEMGSFLIREGQFNEATAAFENALTRIETVFADNIQAEKARSLWYSEAEKAFKGEPYERVMAYYYRGLLALFNEDPETARATFVSGLMQDAFAEEEQHRADFALMDFLTAWSAYKMDSAHLAEVPLERLAALRPGYPLPLKEHNTLIIVEVGNSPRKLADGIGKYALVFREGNKSKEMQAKAKTDKKEIDLYPIENIFWQASTRGARNVDRIIKGKVEFENTGRSVGDVLGSTGSSLIEWSALDNNIDALKEVGAAFAIVGLASKMLSINVDTRADTRYWRSLPATVFIVSTSLSDEELDSLSILPLDKFGNEMFVQSQATHVIKTDIGYNIVWSKTR